MKSKVYHVLIALSCAACAVATECGITDDHSLMQTPPSQQLTNAKHKSEEEEELLSVEADVWPSHHVQASHAHAREMRSAASDDNSKKQDAEEQFKKQFEEKRVQVQARLASDDMLKKQEERAAIVQQPARDTTTNAKVDVGRAVHGRTAAHTMAKSSYQLVDEDSQMRAVHDFFKHAEAKTPTASPFAGLKASLMQVPLSTPPREELIVTDHDVRPRTTMRADSIMARAKQHGQAAGALKAKEQEMQRAKEEEAKEMQQAARENLAQMQHAASTQHETRQAFHRNRVHAAHHVPAMASSSPHSHKKKDAMLFHLPPSEEWQNKTRTTALKTLEIDAGQDKGSNRRILIGQAAENAESGDKQGAKVFANSGGETEQEETSGNNDVVKQHEVVGAVEQEESVENDAGSDAGLRQVKSSGDVDVYQGLS